MGCSDLHCQSMHIIVHIQSTRVSSAFNNISRTNEKCTKLFCLSCLFVYSTNGLQGTLLFDTLISFGASSYPNSATTGQNRDLFLIEGPIGDGSVLCRLLAKGPHWEFNVKLWWDCSLHESLKYSCSRVQVLRSQPIPSSSHAAWSKMGPTYLMGEWGRAKVFPVCV